MRTMADASRPTLDIDAIREAADYWIRSTYSESGRAIHAPSKESTRDEPKTPCRHTPRAGHWRTVELDHLDDGLLKEWLCSECAAKSLGEEYQPGGDNVDYSRTPLDRLAEAGLLEATYRQRSFLPLYVTAILTKYENSQGSREVTNLPAFQGCTRGPVQRPPSAHRGLIRRPQLSAGQSALSGFGCKERRSPRGVHTHQPKF